MLDNLCTRNSREIASYSDYPPMLNEANENMIYSKKNKGKWSQLK